MTPFLHTKILIKFNWIEIASLSYYGYIWEVIDKKLKGFDLENNTYFDYI